MGYFEREAEALQAQMGACANLEWGPARAAIVEAMKKVGVKVAQRQCEADKDWFVGMASGAVGRGYVPNMMPEAVLSALDAEKEEGE